MVATYLLVNSRRHSIRKLLLTITGNITPYIWKLQHAETRTHGTETFIRTEPSA